MLRMKLNKGFILFLLLRYNFKDYIFVVFL
jgi:hypothetical protein